MKIQDETKPRLWTTNFIIITILNLLIFLSFQMYQPTIPLYIKTVLGGSDTIVGIVLGVFALSSLIIRPLAGVGLDYIGRRKVLIPGVFIILLCTISYMLVPTIGFIIFIRLAHGIGWGAATTATNTIASDNIPKARFGEGIGFFSLATGIAMAIGPAVALYMVINGDFNKMFIASTALILVGSILSFFIKFKKVETTNSFKLRRLSDLYEKSSIRASVVMFFVLMTYGAVSGFIALYGSSKGIKDIGLFFTVYAISMLISRPLSGKIVDRYGYNLPVITGLSSMFIAMILLSMASSLIHFLIVAIFYGIGLGSIQSTMQTIAIARVPISRRGAANATYFTSFDVGIGLGVMLSGKISTLVGYEKMFLIISIALIVAAIFHFVYARNKGPN